LPDVRLCGAAAIYSLGMTEVTKLLARIERGDLSATAQLLPLVYDELRSLAAARLSREKPGQTLQATALVHEAYLRVTGDAEPVMWDGRGHFFAAAAEAMRRVLVDNARRKGRVRHGGGFDRAPLDDALAAVELPSDDVLAVHEGLDALAQVDAIAASVVKLHYFLGLPMDETAESLGISPRTASRCWSYARAWLFWRLGSQGS
jgi:RNA polymerase sigma factor (TIGR02999 family)